MIVLRVTTSINSIYLKKSVSTTRIYRIHDSNKENKRAEKNGTAIFNNKHGGSPPDANDNTFQRNKNKFLKPEI